jgi:hypothetical protein
MKFSHEVSIPLSEDLINLPVWLFELTEQDYADCARGHRAIGVIGGAKRLGMVNVESIGGTLIIQHYATQVAERRHVTMVSKASRAYLMHLFPVNIGVIWDMQVSADGPDASRFRCAIELDFPPAVQFLGYFIGAPLFARRHLIEETAGFSHNILKKFGGARTSGSIMSVGARA